MNLELKLEKAAEEIQLLFKHELQLQQQLAKLTHETKLLSDEMISIRKDLLQMIQNMNRVIEKLNSK